MSLIDFPPSPTIGDTYAAGSRMWQYDGSKWVSVVYTSPDDGMVDGGGPSGQSGLVVSNGNPKSTFAGALVIDAGSV